MKTLSNILICRLLAFLLLFAAFVASADAAEDKRINSQHAASVVGTWTWLSRMTLVVKEDHTLDAIYDTNGEKFNEGTWELVDANTRTYRFTYREGGWIDTLTLSPDGRSLDGTNNEGLAIHGTKRD